MAKKKGRVLTKARDLYSSALCGCRGEVINCTVPQTSRTKEEVVGSSRKKEVVGLSKDGNGDLHGLMQLLSMRQGGGAAVDVDSDGNLVWRKPPAETSYAGGVGKIGRIDEDKPCRFHEVDVNKFKCFRDVNAIVNRKNLVYI